MRRLSASFDSSAGALVLTSPSTILFCERLGRKRSGSKPPERSSSYSRKYASTATLLKRTSATGSQPPSAPHWPAEFPRDRGTPTPLPAGPPALTEVVKVSQPPGH